MQHFGRSERTPRVEDVRFLTGKGRYVDDIAPAEALHVLFLRSTVAHGSIRRLDVTAARAMPGVAAVLTAADVDGAGTRLDMKADRIDTRDGGKGAAPERPLLARSRVRFVGEIVAMILAETPDAARDAAEAIELDIDGDEAHVALATGGPLLHPEAPENRAFDFALGDAEAVDRAIAGAAHVVRLTVADNRVIVNSMEPRGAYAEMVEDRLYLCVNGQGVWGPRDDIARHLRMPKADIRVTTPDVGGGFGMKGMSYPEMILVAHAARSLGRPVRWMSDRTEAMLSDNAGRDLVSHATLALDADLRITGYKVETLCNLGAYNSAYAQMIQTELFSKVMPGPYDIPAARLEVQGIYTNTTPVDAYRGAGRPEAIFVLERTLDQAARDLGVDPVDLRRRNFIPPDRFPYTTATGITYDCGDFARVLDRAVAEADLAGLPARRAASAARGRLRGLGLAFYIESILGDEDETSTVVFTEAGAELHVGTQSNGQGHETVYARFLADHTGLPMEAITVRQGDTDLIPEGGGTGGSRSVTVQNAATFALVGRMIPAFAAFLAEREGIDPAAVSFDDERFRLPGSNLSPTLLEAVALARAEGRDDLLRHSVKNRLEGRSFPNGCHVAEVEIDPETGDTRVDRYSVVDDFGNLINPMLVEGQIHGGVAQGLGQILMERTVHDGQGQLLTATFMDYAMPRADSMPFIRFRSEPVPTALNPMGMKGCGEAGTVGALAAITNAVADVLVQALGPRAPRRLDPPFTPERVWALLNPAAGG